MSCPDEIYSALRQSVATEWVMIVSSSHVLNEKGYMSWRPSVQTSQRGQGTGEQVMQQ